MHFVSRGAMNIDGLGNKMVDQLVAAGLVSDVADLFTLTKEDFLSLDLFQEKRADNVIQAIQAAKEVELSRFLFALGIRHVGEQASELIAHFIEQKNSSMWLEIGEVGVVGKSVSQEQWAEIEGVGGIVAQSLFSWFSNPKNQELLQKFEQNGLKLKETTTQNFPQTFASKTFVLTGTLSISREETKKLIKERGGQVSSSVSSKTDYVLAGDNPGSKYQKAEKLGVTILDEDKFRSLI